MRRIAVVAVVIVFGVTAAPSSAWAATMAEARTLRLAGVFAGTTEHVDGAPCGGVALLHHRGRFAVDQRPEYDGAYVIDQCVSLPDQQPPWVLTGTFRITTDRGIVLRGSVSGFTWIDDPTLDPFTLTVEESSGHAKAVRGSIRVTSTEGGLYNGGHAGTFTTALFHP